MTMMKMTSSSSFLSRHCGRVVANVSSSGYVNRLPAIVGYSQHISGLPLTTTATTTSSTITSTRALSSLSLYHITPSSTSLLSSNLLRQKRYMSEGTTTSAADLVTLLDREYQEELENENNQMTTELKEIKERVEKDWKLIDNADDGIVKLYKTLGSSQKVQIYFHCQDTVETEVADTHDDEEEGGSEQNGNANANDDDEQFDDIIETPAVKFTITITKQGKTVIFTCLSDEDGTVHKIQSIAVTLKEDVDTIMKEGGSVDINQYQGPVFHDLADDIQDTFHMYLEDVIGINTDITSFITLYTDYKEQNQYISFLNNIKTIIS